MHFCMDWALTTFDWNRARAFLVTAEEGSLSAAARALGSTQPTLGRQVGALESELGVTLFERVGNRLVLTETGRALLEHVRAMHAAAGRFALSAAGKSRDLEGIVRIAASEAVSAYLLPPMVAELRALHTGVEVELVVSNDPSDLRRREADIAVRNFRPTDPELFAKKIAESRAWMYATPAYLGRLGNPKTARALAESGVEILGFDDVDRMIEALRGFGHELQPRHFPVRTDNHLVQWQLCLGGVGICIMMDQVGDAEPRVVRVLPEIAPPVTFPTWLTCHRELHTSRRIRVVYDLLAERLAH